MKKSIPEFLKASLLFSLLGITSACSSYDNLPSTDTSTAVSAPASASSSTALVVNSFAPTTQIVGGIVILSGTGLAQATQVTVGGFLVTSFVTLGSTGLLIVVPQDAASGSIVVTSSTATATIAGFSLTGYVTATPTPTATPISFHTPTPTPFQFSAFTPTSQYAGGSLIVSGTGLGGVTSVSIGGHAASSFVSLTDSTLLLIVPNAATSGSIVLNTSSSSATLTGFTLLVASGGGSSSTPTPTPTPTGVIGLTVAMLNSAPTMLHMDLPAGLDVTGLNVSSGSLIGMSFAGTTGLTATMVDTSFGGRMRGVRATTQTYFTFPSGFDLSTLSSADFSSLVSYVDFTGTTNYDVTNLPTSHLGIIFPAGFDASTFSARSGEFDDFSQSTGLPASYINSGDIYGVKLPAGFDVTQLDFVNTDLEYVDFTGTTGLTIQNLNDAAQNYGMDGMILPAGFDVTGLTYGVSMHGVDFSGVIHLTTTMLDHASDISYVKLPTGFDASQLDYSNDNIQGVNFKGTTGLTATLLNSAIGNSRIDHITLPDNFDATGLNVASVTLTGIDFSKTLHLTVAMLESSNDFTFCSLPAGLDVSTFDYTSDDFTGVSFIGTTGLTLSLLNTADQYNGITYISLPANFDVTGWDLSVLNDTTGINFSGTLRRKVVTP